MTSYLKRAMQEQLLTSDSEERERYVYFDEMKQSEDILTGRLRTFRRDFAAPDIHILTLSSNAPARYEFVTLRQLLQHITSDFLPIISCFSNEDSALKDLRYRDLRRLDHDSAHEDAPSLTQRRFVNILVLPPLKCIMTSRRLILIVPTGADSLLSYVQDCIGQNDALKDSGDSIDFINFEFSACNTTIFFFCSHLFIYLYLYLYLSTHIFIHVYI